MLETLLTNGSVRGSWTKPSFATATRMWRASQSVKTHNQNHDNLLVTKLLTNKTFRWFDHKHAHEILVVLKNYKVPIWLFGVLLHEQNPRFVEELFGSLLFFEGTPIDPIELFLGTGGKRKPPNPLPTIIFQGRTRENYGVDTLHGVEGYEHEACNSTYLAKTPNPKRPTLITSYTRTASMIKISINYVTNGSQALCPLYQTYISVLHKCIGAWPILQHLDSRYENVVNDCEITSVFKSYSHINTDKQNIKSLQ